MPVCVNVATSPPQRKTVKVYPWETIVHLNQSSIHDKDASIVYSMPLDNFNEVSVKSKVSNLFRWVTIDHCYCMFSIYIVSPLLIPPPSPQVLTVYEMFGRQLVHLPKFSIDRAFAVLEKYPTVSQ